MKAVLPRPRLLESRLRGSGVAGCFFDHCEAGVRNAQLSLRRHKLILPGQMPDLIKSLDFQEHSSSGVCFVGMLELRRRKCRELLSDGCGSEREQSRGQGFALRHSRGDAGKEPQE
jgi:hypothetical protein